jgi:hypothetical protein
MANGNGDERPAPPAGQPLAEAIGYGFQQLIEGLRTDVREDIRDLREEWRVFAVEHGKAHENEAIERRLSHGEFYEYIRKAEVDNARKDGALGVVRFVIEKLSANATRLVAVILALASVLMAITGQIHFTVGR